MCKQPTLPLVERCEGCGEESGLTLTPLFVTIRGEHRWWQLCWMCERHLIENDSRSARRERDERERRQRATTAIVRDGERRVR